jgi:hypothetical protein
MLAADYHAKNLDDMIPNSPQSRAMTSPLAHHIEETSHFIFWKAGKMTLQTSSF